MDPGYCISAGFPEWELVADIADWTCPVEKQTNKVHCGARVGGSLEREPIHCNECWLV